MNLENAKKIVAAVIGGTARKSTLNAILTETPDPYWKQLQDMRLALLKNISAGFESSFEITPYINEITHLVKENGKVMYITARDVKGPVSELTTDQLVWIEQRII